MSDMAYLVGAVGAHIGLALAATDGFFASIGAAMTGFLVGAVMVQLQICSADLEHVRPVFRRDMLRMQICIMFAGCLAGVWYGGLTLGWLWGAAALLATGVRVGLLAYRVAGFAYWLMGDDYVRGPARTVRPAAHIDANIPRQITRRRR